MITPNEPQAGEPGPNAAPMEVTIHGKSETQKAKIPLIRFTRPNGVREKLMLPVTTDTLMKWQRLQAYYKAVDSVYLQLTVEELGNGTENLCIEHPNKGDIEIAVMNPRKMPIGVRFMQMIDALYEKHERAATEEEPKS